MSDIPGLYFFNGLDTVVSVTGECCEKDDTKEFSTIIQQPVDHKDRQYIPKIAGIEPNVLVQCLLRDKDAAGLMRHKRRHLLGKGICAMKREIVDGKKTYKYVELKAWDDFVRKNRAQFQGYLRQRINNLVFFRNMATEFRWNEKGELYSIRNIDFQYVHSGKRNDDGIVEWYLVGDIRKLDNCEWVMAYDANKKQEMIEAGKAIHFNSDHIPGNGYYAYPDYIGALRQLKIRELICDYYISGFKNGWSPKLHIELPAEYVDHIWEAKKKFTKNEGLSRKDVLDELAKTFKDKFEGTSKNQSTIITETWVDDEGKEHKIEIKPLDQKITGDQYMKLAEHTQKTTSVSLDVAQALTGYGNESNLASGSEIMNHINYEETYKAYDDRQMILESIYEIANCLGIEEDFEFVFEGFQFVTADLNKNKVVPTADGDA